MADEPDRRANERRPAAPTGRPADATRSFRSQLTTGEDVVDPHDVGRVDSPSAGHRAPCADRQEPVVQPAVVAADRVRRPDRRGGGREGSAQHAVGRAVHRPLPRHHRDGRCEGESRASGLGRRPALLQPVPADLHHPVRGADPQRSPSACTGRGTARPARTGSASRSRFRATRCGPRSRIPSACRDRSACPASGTRSASPAGGTSGPIPSGCSTGSSSTCCCSRPVSGVAWCPPPGRCSPTRCRS